MAEVQNARQIQLSCNHQSRPKTCFPKLGYFLPEMSVPDLQLNQIRTYNMTKCVGSGFFFFLHNDINAAA